MASGNQAILLKRLLGPPKHALSRWETSPLMGHKLTLGSQKPQILSRFVAFQRWTLPIKSLLLSISFPSIGRTLIEANFSPKGGDNEKSDWETQQESTGKWTKTEHAPTPHPAPLPLYPHSFPESESGQCWLLTRWRGWGTLWEELLQTTVPATRPHSGWGVSKRKSLPIAFSFLPSELGMSWCSALLHPGQAWGKPPPEKNRKRKTSVYDGFLSPLQSTRSSVTQPPPPQTHTLPAVSTSRRVSGLCPWGYGDGFIQQERGYRQRRRRRGKKQNSARNSSCKGNLLKKIRRNGDSEGGVSPPRCRELTARLSTKPGEPSRGALCLSAQPLTARSSSNSTH